MNALLLVLLPYTIIYQASGSRMVPMGTLNPKGEVNSIIIFNTVVTMYLSKYL